MNVNQFRHPVSNSVCSSAEEIVNLLMQVVLKKERCWDCDIQHWCTMYRHFRHEVNFPEVSMLIDCSAQIYGRKADYLCDMIRSMSYGQQVREQTESATVNGEGVTADNPTTSTARKRAGPLNPQSSDCFADLEFTCSDKKLLKFDALIKTPQIIEVDRRTKGQQMLNLYSELRANPNRQRRQQILNRLRDEANIVPVLSSHGVARKNQIFDLESGEAIGTRYDYQVYQNFIDNRTGSLIAEHDLKGYFQRLDVIELLNEQQDAERERCTHLGMPAPTDLLSLREREVKIFMPPEYLKDRYRINVYDTSDFDNALTQARVSNYNSDPILALMDPAERERCHKEMEQNGHDSSRLEHDSGCADESSSFQDVLCSTRLCETNSEEAESLTYTENPSQMSTEMSKEIEDGLLRLEPESKETKPEDDFSSAIALRLSVDEGIGVDRESPTRSSSVTQENYGKLLFTTRTIIPRQIVQRPVQLHINLFGIPEQLTQKNVVFTLPQEYRNLKKNLIQRDQTNDCSRINLYSLHPTALSNPLWTERPTTPELEDFLGFEDCDEEGSTSECDFTGFTDEEVADARKEIEKLHVPSNETTQLDTPKRTPKTQQTSEQTTSSPPVTPSRTLSCDSGISDTAERSKEHTVSAMNSCQKTITDENENEFVGEHPKLQAEESVVAAEVSNAPTQQSSNEIQERIEKVNAWHRKLKPVLLESEKRNHFDVHAYGTDIIDTFDHFTPSDGIGVTFANVLEGKPPHSTARYFLSLLMLANTNNVEIINKNLDPSRLSTTDEIELLLMSRKRHHQEMEEMIELLPNATEREGGRRMPQNRKRKLTLGRHEPFQRTYEHGEAESRDSIVRPDPSERLGLGSPPVNERNFIDDVQHLYPQLNSEESKLKRMAFRRGMRNCTYGLLEEILTTETSAGTSQKQHDLNRTIREPNIQCNIRQSIAEHTSDTPGTSYSDSRTCSQPASSGSAEVEEDILMVDLATNRATLTRDPDEMCTRSVFSLAESGYESILSATLENMSR